MNKIVTVNQAIEKSEQLRNHGKRVVLAGGCFDILHIGHITFLEKAKAAGDSLFVMLESDTRIKKIKGENRPINSQEIRAKILAAIEVVDFVILLAPNLIDQVYDEMIIKLKPAIIATTQGDLSRSHKERQAAKVGCRVIDVAEYIKNQSTSRFIKLLG